MKTLRNKLLWGFMFFALAFSLASCDQEQKEAQIIETKEMTDETIDVVTSIIPLASIANYIGGDYVDAVSLVPAGVSPHGFDLKPTQLVDLENADLIVYLELDHIDGFLDKPIADKVSVLSVSSGIELLESEEHDHHDDEEHHKEEDEHGHGHDDEHEEDDHHGEDEHEDEDEHSFDPHIWSSAENAYVIAQKVVTSLSLINPEKAKYFEENLASFKDELDAAKKDFQEKTNNKTQGGFIVFHDAYNYLFEELSIDDTKKHIFRKDVLNDPNSNEMKELIDEIVEENIKVAFREPQLDSSNLNNVASEYSLEILILNPLWTDDSKEGYINNYKNNLQALEKIYE